jgi:hypothetical protein
MQLFFPNIIIIIIIPSSTQSPLTHVTWATLIRVFFFALAHLMDEMQFGCLQYHPFNSITTNAFCILPRFMSFFSPLAHFMDEMQIGCHQYHHPFNPININNAP